MLDRDCTMIVERHYLSDPDGVELVPGAARGLSQLSEAGLGLVVITNQSGIGRGLFDEARLDLIHRRLCVLLEAEGVRLDGIYFCPHTPQDDCLCRKPGLRLLETAANDLGFDRQDCFVVGDKSCDIELGQRAGATTFLVRTGYGAQTVEEGSLRSDYTVDDLWEASQVIRAILNPVNGRVPDDDGS